METAFAWLAVVMFVVFICVDVIWRGYVYWRSTGSTGVPRRSVGLTPTDLIGGAVAFAGISAIVAGAVLAAS